MERWDADPDSNAVKTSERCDECGYFLVFIPEGSEVDQEDNEIEYGVYQCPRCGFEEYGDL